MKRTTPPQCELPKSKKQKKTPSRLRRFVFTLNNWTEEELESIKNFECKWMICAKETGESNTPHLQGACVIGKQLSFSTIKKYHGFKRAHIEPMNGSPSDSLRYCSKQDGAPFIKGQLPQPGKRNDIHAVCDQLRAGKSMGEIIRDPNDNGIAAIVKYHKGFQYISSVLTPSRTEPPVVVWLYGPTGLGKTRCSVELGTILGGSNGFWLSSGSLRWFDGYFGQSVAIFDDLRTKHAPFHQLLRLLDRYPMSVEIKGSYVSWVPRYIFITAPKSPSQMWDLRTPEDIGQLERRVSHEINVAEFADYGSLLLTVQTRLGAQEDDDISNPLLPRGIIDVTNGSSSSGSQSGGEEEKEEEEKEKEKDEEEDDSWSSADHLVGLFNHASVSFCGQPEIINID
jgi:hypothetical protein